MVWYNPFTWGKEAAPAAPVAAPAAAAPAPAAPAPAAPAYGGRHRKTHRRGRRKGSKKIRSGRKSTRS